MTTDALSIAEERLDESERQAETLQEWVDALMDENASLIDERNRLREAVENVMFDEWGYRESEAPDMQDELTRLGLLVEVPADEDFKREWDADTMLTFAWSPLAAKEKPYGRRRGGSRAPRLAGGRKSS